MYDVITVGSATVDVFAHTEYSKMLKGKNNEEFIAYPIGSKILIEELNMSSGGGGTNTAASLSKLGHKVAYLGKIGTKENSHRIILELKKHNIDTSLIVRSSTSRTGYSVILDSIKHDRTILTFRGSSNNLKFNEINLRKVKTKWFYFSSMMGQSYKTLEKLASYAKKNNIKIAFNVSSYLAKKGKKYLKSILNKTNILVLNHEEACLIVGKGKMQVLLKKLHSLGPEIVTITDGVKGAWTLYNGYVYFGKTSNIKVVESTGAGDAFASSFLSGWIKKQDIGFAVALGTTNAESVIQHHGAKNKLLTYKEALKIMKKRPVKVTKNLI